MRLSFRTTLAFVVGIAFAGCSGGNVVLAPAGKVISLRGTLIGVTGPVVISQASMAADQNAALLTPIGGAPQCDVDLYTVRYNTIGAKGEPTTASAGYFVPTSGCGSGPYPIVAYAHGTNVVKAQLINDPTTSNEQLTAPDQLPIVVASIYAAHGYAAIATDYLGLGLSNYPYHPYLQDASEASAVIDALRAARLASQKLGIGLTGEVFISGHSQGGQSAVATQRAIEQQFPSEFKLLGDAPSSGPYFLSKTFLDGIQNPGQDAPILATYAIVNYQNTYGNVYTQPTDVFAAPYAAGITTLLPVATLQDQIALEGQTLPLSTSSLLQPAFTTDFLNDANNGFRQDLVQNDLLQGWQPVAPVFLCGGSRDPEVEFANATAALAYFGSARATLTDVDPYIPASVPITSYHVTVADVCLPLARAKFFDAIRAAEGKAAGNRI